MLSVLTVGHQRIRLHILMHMMSDVRLGILILLRKGVLLFVLLRVRVLVLVRVRVLVCVLAHVHALVLVIVIFCCIF